MQADYPNASSKKEAKIMKKRIITISRQFGSGGHSIAKTVAERLGVPF